MLIARHIKALNSHSVLLPYDVNRIHHCEGSKIPAHDRIVLTHYDRNVGSYPLRTIIDTLKWHLVRERVDQRHIEQRHRFEERL